MRSEISAIDPRAVFVNPMEQLGDIYAALDCFLLVSKSEAFSLSLIEAWLTGVPVVATQVGAIPELESVYGQLVWPVTFDATSEELATAVHLATQSAGPAVDMANEARILAEREFTAQAMGRRWTDYMLDMTHEEEALESAAAVPKLETE
jgi:glycosyltransferase involved in cell wall biosynthesis